MSVPENQPPQPGLASAVRTVSGVTLLSRVGGLVRDLMLIRVFGEAGPVSSAFLAGFAVPNMFRRLFGEGALSAAFIPEYARAQRDDPAAAGRLASLIVTALAAFTCGLTALIEAVLLVVLFAAPGTPDRQLAIKLVMVMLPFMPLVCSAALLSGMLQVHGRFGPASAGPIILNGFIIAVGAYYLATGQIGDERTAYVLGIATVLSGLTQCLWYLRLLRPYARWTGQVAQAVPAASRMLRRFVPVLIGMGTLQINTLMDTLLATWPIWVGPTMLGAACPMDEKSTSILAFTQRLYQFPLGVFGIAVATAVFPMLARHAGDSAAFSATLRRGLRLSLYIGLPASLGLYLVRHDLTYVLFSFGTHGFGADSLARSAAVLAGFAPAVWAYSLNHVYTRAFYAHGDTRTPMMVALGMLGLNLALNFGLIWPLREAGLAWSTSISAIVQCLLLTALARRFVPDRLVDGPTAVAALNVAAATTVMGVVVWLSQAFLPLPQGWSGRAIALSVSCLVGVAVYAAASRILRCPEFEWLTRRNQP